METHVSLDSWIITAVSGGGLTILGFLLKHSFGQIQKGIENLSKELKAIDESLSTVKSDVRVLEEKLKNITFRVEQLEKGK